MSISENMSYPPPRTDTEKLAWLLWNMIESSEIREEHFKYRDNWNRQFIMSRGNFLFDAKTGFPTKNQQLYGAIHADYIFYVMGIIESFQGALAAAWEVTHNRPDFVKAFQIIINPGRYIGNVQGILNENNLSEEQLCRLLCIPPLTDFDVDISSQLRNIMQKCFEKTKIAAQYSQKYWLTLKGVRNVYAHNFRFIFFDGVIPLTGETYDNYVIGHLETSEDLVQHLVFVGGRQRIATGELAFLLGSITRWVYTNIRISAVNNGRLVLPLSIPEATPEQRLTYEEIWKKQNYDFNDEKKVVYGIREARNQVALHEEWLNVLSSWGHKLQTVDQKAREGTYAVDKLKAAKKRLRERRQPKRKR